MSQDDLATAVGVSRNTISNWERGVHEPGPADFDSLARTLSASERYLRGESEGEVRYELVPGPPGVVAEAQGYRTASSRIPPEAYKFIWDRCAKLERAGVPDEIVIASERILAGEHLRGLRVRELVVLDAAKWLELVQMRWRFLAEDIKGAGYKL